MYRHCSRINAPGLQNPTQYILSRGCPIITLDPYCNPPKVSKIYIIRELCNNLWVTHPRTNLATPCSTSLILQKLVSPKCSELSKENNKISPPIHLLTYEALCKSVLTLTIVLLAILKITVYTELLREQ